MVKERLPLQSTSTSPARTLAAVHVLDAFARFGPFPLGPLTSLRVCTSFGHVEEEAERRRG